MDCVFIGPWIFKWWQKWCADVCYLFSPSLEAIVQMMQVRVANPTSNKASGKVRNWKAHPVTVSEYVKSWMHDDVSALSQDQELGSRAKGQERNEIPLNSTASQQSLQ